MGRLLATLAAVGFGLGLGAAALAGFLVWASLPMLEGEIRLAGLGAPARVSRDELGVPLIEAASERDAAMALGFVHAQDRLWQMEINRRIGAGRLAEVVGERGLAVDRFMRTLGLYRAAEASLDHLSAEALDRLAAYAEGVNGFLAQRAGPLPPEFLLLRHRPEPWRPADSLVLIKLMALDLVSSWRSELTRASLLGRLPPAALADLWPPPRPDEVTTLPGAAQWAGGLPSGAGSTDPAAAIETAALAEALGAALPLADNAGLGSNIWAVAGAHTASGAALLANDPHLGLATPAHWYLAAMRTPAGTVLGATLPALPAVVIGRNEHIAWGFTNTAGDTDDLFVERLDPADPDRYLTPDGSRPFLRRDEVIEVRGGEAVHLLVRETRHGPVVSDIMTRAAEVAGEGRVLALAWTALLPEDRTIEAGIGLARARDWDGFTRAIALFHSPTQNAFYADAEGRIGMVMAGRLPLRRAGDGSLPAPGWDGSHDWLGLLPAAENPATPGATAAGFLQNANNRLVDDRYPHLVTADWNDDLRARRITAVLDAATAEGAPLDIDAMRRLQNDRLSTLAADFRPRLEAVAPADAETALILAAIAAWDGAAMPDRPEPLVFQAWYRSLVRHVLADELGEGFAAFRGIRSEAMRHILEQAPGWCDDVATADRTESCGDMATAALASSLDELRATYGADWRSWRWGEASRARLAHRPLDAAPGIGRLFSIVTGSGGGDAGTVHVARYAADMPYATVAAASLRLVADLARSGTLHAILPTGQSGHPLSPHFSDQTGLWRNGELHTLEIAQPVGRGRSELVLRP
ncbi:MAG TPA: penicillin acylase family protein [Geminicoccaceae bacterium]|nr:penicillin acylase family protein [Geminicoccaceae bacterium]